MNKEEKHITIQKEDEKSMLLKCPADKHRNPETIFILTYEPFEESEEDRTPCVDVKIRTFVNLDKLSKETQKLARKELNLKSRGDNEAS